jgi:tyrosine-protein kinase Etk/Wzc
LEPGLAQVLAGQCTWEEAIVALEHGGLHVLPAGRLTANPHRLLAGGGLAALLAEAGAGYHHIVLDTPPLLAAGEALVLAKAADACLICTMQGVSRMSHVLRARQRLEAAGGRLAGVVLNGVSSRHYAYAYGDYAYPRH